MECGTNYVILFNFFFSCTYDSNEKWGETSANATTSSSDSDGRINVGKVQFLLVTLLCLIDWSIIENTSFGCHSWKIPKVCWDKHSWRRCGHESGLKRFPWKIQRQNVVVCHQNTSSGFTLTNTRTQSWTVVTGLLAFMVLTSITSWSESNVMQCRGFETKPNCFRCSWCEFEFSVVWILIDYDELRSFWVSPWQISYRWF